MQRPSESAVWRWAYYAAPMVICLYVHWLGLKTWFTADDFAWLSLKLQIHNFHDLMWALFAPLAQGTVRTLSERVYFLLLSSLFGLNALPFRICAFLTQFASIALLTAITRRITRSNLAGFLAPVFWCVHGAMTTAMNWDSAYNELLCGFFLLSAFYFLLNHIESGSRRDLAGLWICFLLGFGALEHIVVFPALAALYSLCLARNYFVKTLPLFLPSIAFALAHFYLIPHTSSTDYQLYFDSSLFSTFGKYWLSATDAFRPGDPIGYTHGIGLALTIALTVSLVGFSLWRLLKDDTRGIFFLGWYVLLLGPVLPLKNHIYDYYLTLPLTGLAMLGAWACSYASSWKPTATLAAALACTYLYVSMFDLRINLRWYYDRARIMKTVVLGVDAAHKAHPNNIIFLAGVGSDLFWTGFGDHPFRAFGIGHVYLTPGTENKISPPPSLDQISGYIAPPGAALDALRRNQAAAYAIGRDGLVDVTAEYISVLATQNPDTAARMIDAGNPLFAGSLGPEWYSLDGGFRWMPKTATLTIAGPSAKGQSLEVSGFFPETIASHGPVRLAVSADSIDLGSTLVDKAGAAFMRKFALPGALVGRPLIHLKITLDHTTRIPGDPRDFGLVFGKFAIESAAN